MNTKRGFTLIELLIVIAIISMLMAIGLSSFQSIMASSRLTSVANAMVSALQLARFEALKQHKQVVVTKNTSWTNGWIVFVDSNGNKAQDSNEPPLAIFDALSSIIAVTNNLATASAGYVYYDANGRSNTKGTFSFCLPAGTNQDFRSVVIAVTGRTHVESTSTTPASTYANDCQ